MRHTNYIYYCMTFIALICCDTLLSANKDLDVSVDASLCTKEVLMTFFPQPVVKAVLVRYQVPEQEAEIIAKELSNKDQEVVKIVEYKASKLDPNPLRDLGQRDTAVKVFRETLFEVLAKELKSHKVIENDDQIQTVLEDIQAVKGKLFVDCIKKEYPKTK